MQMNKVHDYGGVKDEQLRTLEHLGVFKAKLTKPLKEYPRLTDPTSSKADLSLRHARTCKPIAQCHIHAGGGNSLMDLDFTTKKKRAPVRRPSAASDVRNHRSPIDRPGQPDRSVLLQRMSRRGPDQMPPLATSVVDKEAVRMLREWIAQMK